MKSGNAAIYIKLYCIISGLKAPHHPTRTKYEVPHLDGNDVCCGNLHQLSYVVLAVMQNICSDHGSDHSKSAEFAFARTHVTESAKNAWRQVIGFFGMRACVLEFFEHLQMSDSLEEQHNTSIQPYLRRLLRRQRPREVGRTPIAKRY